MECETQRKRHVGKVRALFCDFPWSSLRLFRKAQTGRAALTTLPLLAPDKSVIRPVGEAALAVADTWVQAALSGDPTELSLVEYFTGKSEVPPDIQAEEDEEQEPTVSELQARIRELEAGRSLRREHSSTMGQAPATSLRPTGQS